MATRLSKTAVQQAVRFTRTRDFVDTVSDTRRLEDGRRKVVVTLHDVLDDVRATPAGTALIGHLEEAGWVVEANRGRRASWLVITEPASA